MNKLDLPPDLHSRNYIISKGIAEFKKQNNFKKIKILDIGGRNGRLDAFIDPEDEIIILDLRKGDEPNLIIGDATDMGFKDDSFDIVVSGDVFEHIPQKVRRKFILESFRVAKHLVVLAAPFSNESIIKSEKLVRDFFREAVGRDHEWLKEHSENGLPSRKKIEKQITNNKYRYTVVGSNSIDNWLLIQYFDILKYTFDCPNKDQIAINRFYNSNIERIENASVGFYRYVYFITKKYFEFNINYDFSPKIKNLYEAKILRILNMCLTRRDSYINKLGKYAKEVEDNLKSAQEHKLKVDLYVKDLENSLAEKVKLEAEVADLRRVVEVRDAEKVKLKEEILFLKNASIKKDNEQRELEREINKLKCDIAEKEEHKLKVDQYVRDLEGIIEDILSSRAWRIVNLVGYPYSRIKHYIYSIKQEIENNGFFLGLYSSFLLFLTRILKVNLTGFRDFHSIKKESDSEKRIVFISGCPGDTMRYRAYHQQEELAHHGVKSDVFKFDEVNTKNILNLYDILILHRVPITPGYEELITSGKRLGKIFIFDTDDLIFDEKYGEHIAALDGRSKAEVELYYDGLRRFAKTLSLCDYAICSTEYLKQELVSFEKKTYINRNAVSDELRELSRIALINKRKRKDNKLIIGYLSGTRTHNRDFKEAEDALIEILNEYDNVTLCIGGHLDICEKFCPFADKIIRLPFMSWKELPRHLADFDINISPLEDNPFCNSKSDLKYFEAALLKCPTIASNVGDFKTTIRSFDNGVLASNKEEWLTAFRRLLSNEKLRKKIGENAYADVIKNRTTYTTGKNLIKILRDIKYNNELTGVLPESKHILREKSDDETNSGDKNSVQSKKKTYSEDKWPKFSVISVLYNKEREIIYFLESFLRQNYKGKFEIILIDDCSPDNSVEVVKEFIERAKTANSYQYIPDLKIIRNKENIGNCNSRNTGIKHAKGDILVIVDADCMVNEDFLKLHAEAYFYKDCEVAIGPFNIETNEKEPITVLNYYESNPNKAEKDALLQDTVNKRSFLNCITRNFSIKKDFIREELFDSLFSYSKKEDSGFGWEDIEMGYRLYKRGGTIKYIPNAFSVHVSHPSAIDEETKPVRSIRNFRRLYEKHPHLLYVARRWSLDTYQKICDWLDTYNIKNNEDREFLDNMFQHFIPPPFYLSGSREKKLKVLSYRWHCAHQYEIYKLPYEFTLVTGLGTGITEFWEYDRRPLPENVRFKHINQINVEDYDLAILHFDENVLSPENTNGIIRPEWKWGDTFKWFVENVNTPKVGICHGTPQFYGQYDINYKKDNLMKVIENERKKLVEFVGDMLIINNSRQAQNEWGFKKSKVIWHGFDPTEFPQTTYEKNILVMTKKAMINRPYYNGYFLYNEVFKKKFPKEYLPESLPILEHNQEYERNTNQYGFANFNSYIKELGKYSLYFNPTLRSPMPRTRGEAMMCGLAIVTTKSHDVELFIKNGINGFYSDEPAELKEYLLYLIKNPQKAKEIGLAGRKLAMDIFNHDRFLKAWEDTITDILVR